MPATTASRTQISNQELFARYSESFYRRDIQGIRAISALLIMIYHIWLGRVSGGVDVFFVISGFLVTTTLLRSLAKSGRLRPDVFLARIFRRILPSALTVLLTTLAFTVVFVPAPLWKYSVDHFIASTAQVENLQLIRMGTDYLAREAPPSQFQQFWALSIQMQFYILLLAVIAGLSLVSRKLGSLKPLIVGVAVLLAASFAFSVLFTSIDAPAAYFHPATRIWEFLAGSLVALTYPSAQPSAPTTQEGHTGLVWNVLSATALTVLATLGLTLGGTSPFPGWVAVIPVLCATVLIYSGRLQRRTLANRLLASPSLAYLGGFSFLIYLWHWPVLVFSHYHFNTTELNLPQGLFVVSIAIILAASTKQVIEDPLNRKTIRRPKLTLVGYAALITIIACGGLLLRFGILHLAASRADSFNQSTHAKALQLPSEVDIPLRDFVAIDLDRPQGISCLSNDCVGGDPDSDRVIVMAGASHSAQWFDVVDQLGQDAGYRVLTRFGRSDLASLIEDVDADVLIMNATKTDPSAGPGSETLALEDPREWIDIAQSGVHVIGIRDNPRFDFYQNACVWENQENAGSCSIPQDSVLNTHNPALALADDIEGFRSVDLTRFFCVDGTCPAVHDNVFIYYDKHHISMSYSNYIETEVVNELRAALPPR